MQLLAGFRKCGEPIGCSYWKVLGNAENLLDAAIGSYWKVLGNAENSIGCNYFQ
jgi:hypothetical protein